jgi:4-amino-4-deoxy-L-arabinose transferase-like glycosyltransferase
VSIFLLAIVVRVAFTVVIGLGMYPTEPVLIARSLADSNTFADPYKIPTGATAHTGPAFPFILSLVYRLFGTGTAGVLTSDILHWVVVSLQYALLPVVAAALGIPAGAGVLAGIAGALLPLKVITELQGGWEAPYTALLLLLLSLAMYRYWQDFEFRTRTALWTGFAWGIGFLFSPTLIPALAGLLGAGLLLAWPQARARHLRYAAIVIAASFLTSLPWAVRNYATLGTFAIRDNLGLEMAISYYEGAGVRISDNFHPEPYGLHPSVSTRECRRIIEIGEAAYNREKMDAALEWIGANPAEAARLAGLRFAFFWFQWNRVIVRDAIAWVITLAGIAGLVLIVRRRRVAGVLFLTLWLSYPLVYYVIEASTRYRYPIDWTFLLLGGYAAVEGLRRVRERSGSRSNEMVMR